MGCSMSMFRAISLVHSNFQANPFFRMGMFSNLKRLANSGDPDETARYEPAHLDLHWFATVVSKEVCGVEWVNIIVQHSVAIVPYLIILTAISVTIVKIYKQ